MTQAVLYYVHDPMCSWCWGYRPVWLKLRDALPKEVQMVMVLGGLAPDTDQLMPEEMQQAIEGHWRKIQSMLGTTFNFDFWTSCQPRRDTYKASRAVIAAAEHGLEEEMNHAIQRAYYMRAMNPSEPETLAQLAGEIGLDKDAFRPALVSEKTEKEFRSQVNLARRLGVRSFPSLVLKTEDQFNPVLLDYRDHLKTLDEINSRLKGTRQEY
jgi:putative protein-disulfide isomerase